MKSTNIIFRIDEELKDDFQKVVELNNYSISSVLTACIKDIVRKKKIPINLLSYLNSKSRSKKISIPLIKKVLNEILLSMNDEKVKKAYLFGSYARGEETLSSDIDIRIEVSSDFSLIDLGYISSELKEKLNRNIDLIAGELEPKFLNRIKQEEICIYENL